MILVHVETVPSSSTGSERFFFNDLSTFFLVDELSFVSGLDVKSITAEVCVVLLCLLCLFFKMRFLAFDRQLTTFCLLAGVSICDGGKLEHA